jgi:hypothetical protein
MPNNKTFDESDKYDHSSHSTANREKGDLAPTPDAAANKTPVSGNRGSPKEHSRAKSRQPNQPETNGEAPEIPKVGSQDALGG